MNNYPIYQIDTKEYRYFYTFTNIYFFGVFFFGNLNCGKLQTCMVFPTLFGACSVSPYEMFSPRFSYNKFDCKHSTVSRANIPDYAYLFTRPTLLLWQDLVCVSPIFRYLTIIAVYSSPPLQIHKLCIMMAICRQRRT